MVNVVGVVEFTQREKLELIENNGELKDINYYYPSNEVPRINVLRVLDDKEVEQHGLDFKTKLLKQELDFGKTREKILEVFSKFCSPKYAQFLLYSIVNNSQRMGFYISGENLEPLLRHLLPHIVLVDVRIPFKQ